MAGGLRMWWCCRYSVAECDAYCFGMRHSLSALARNGQCHCSSIIPDEEIMLTDADCRFKGGAALYYHFASKLQQAGWSAVQSWPS